MPKAPTGKWPRIQFSVICKTCKRKIKVSINYGESNVWNNTGAGRFAEWAQHEDHDLEVEYEFYDGYDRKATE